jgi:DNA repair exonuclease SbcCD ATPase subunit
MDGLFSPEFVAESVARGLPPDRAAEARRWLSGEDLALPRSGFLQAKSAERDARILAHVRPAAERRRPSVRLARLEWRWTYCYGSNNCFDFDAARGKAVVLTGKNGSGKTAFLETVILALFGSESPGRAGKPSAIVNKAMPAGSTAGTSVAFSIGGLSFRIQREFAVKGGKLAQKATVLDGEGGIVCSGKPAVDRWVSANAGTAEGFLTTSMVTQRNDHDFLRMRAADQKAALDEALRPRDDILAAISESKKAHRWLGDALAAAAEAAARFADADDEALVGALVNRREAGKRETVSRAAAAFARARRCALRARARLEGGEGGAEEAELRARADRYRAALRIADRLERPSGPFNGECWACQERRRGADAEAKAELDKMGVPSDRELVREGMLGCRSRLEALEEARLRASGGDQGPGAAELAAKRALLERKAAERAAAELVAARKAANRERAGAAALAEAARAALGRAARLKETERAAAEYYSQIYNGCIPGHLADGASEVLGDMAERPLVASWSDKGMAFSIGDVPVEKACGFESAAYGLAARLAVSSMGVGSVQCRQLFLDEAFASFDEANAGKLPALLERLLGRFESVTVVTHDAALPAAIGDCVRAEASGGRLALLP